MPIPAFEKFVKNPYPGTLLTFDPGQTSGWSKWQGPKLVECGQLGTFPVADSVRMLDRFIYEHFRGCPDDQKMVVIEEYRVYQHKTESHAHQDMHTSRLIGCLETLCVQQVIRYQMCGAGLAKTFCTDEKLEAWGFWQRGQKHARDAIRHGVYWLCTPPK